MDEIETFYRHGDPASEIPRGDFDLKRMGITAGGLALTGLMLGVSYNRLHEVVWAAPVGTLVGALLGALLALGSGPWTMPGPVTRVGGLPLLGSNPEQFGRVRLLTAGMAMAFLGTLLTAHWGTPSARRLVAWWAIVGLILMAEAYAPLPSRLCWLLGHARMGLLFVLLAYFGWLVGMVLVYQVAPPVMAFYTHLPKIGLGQAVQHLLVMTLTAGGMVLGLWADNSIGINRRQNALAMLQALVPGLGIVAPGFMLGYIIFSVLGAATVRGWGALATVLAAEVTMGWLMKFQAAQMARLWGRVRGVAGQLAARQVSKVPLPPWATSTWSKVQKRLPAAPAGGWLAGLTLTTAVGVAGTLALLAPLAAHIILSMLLAMLVVLGCLIATAVIIGLLVWFVRTR